MGRVDDRAGAFLIEKADVGLCLSWLGILGILPGGGGLHLKLERRPVLRLVHSRLRAID